VETTIGQEVVHELLGVKTSKTIASLVDLRIKDRAGLTHFLQAVLEEVLVSSLVVGGTKGLLKVRVLAKVELAIIDIRAGTALLDTILMPVVTKLGSITVEGVLEIRILVVVELGIEDQVLGVGNSHGANRDGSEAHSGNQTLRIALVLEVPDELLGSESIEPWVAGLVDLRVEQGAGLTVLVDAELEEVLVSSLVVGSTKSLLKVRVLAKVELAVIDNRAGTALLDTILMPVVMKLGSITVEGVLEIRVLVVVELGVEDSILHVAKGTLGRNTSQDHLHHFVTRVFSRRLST